MTVLTNNKLDESKMGKPNKITELLPLSMTKLNAVLGENIETRRLF